MSENPYQPPTTEPAPPVAPPRRFRWRVIPVAILGPMGALSLLGALGMGFEMLLATGADNPPDSLQWVQLALLALNSSNTLGTAVFLWRGRWGLAGVCFALVMVCGLALEGIF